MRIVRGIALTIMFIICGIVFVLFTSSGFFAGGGH